MSEKTLEFIANELVDIRQEIQDAKNNAMPWRLQIAAYLMAGNISNENMNRKLLNSERSRMFLDLADSLILTHEETK